MAGTIPLLASLLAVVAAVAILSDRLKTPPAILLVLTGVALALLPGLPRLALSPDFVLLVVLPPLIYSTAVRMSWREFQTHLGSISLLAVGCVVFTALATAAVTHWLLGLSWPLGLLTGAIVSPPDALAPLAIARRLHLPRRLAVVLEGEGLANDATALVLCRFAIMAVSTGAFSLGQAAGTFVAVVLGEVVWGLAVGWAMLRLRRWVAEPSIEILLSILTPFMAYWPPEHLGGSGVLAAAAAGLYVSRRGPGLISAATRIQGVFFWDFLIYLIEGLVFLVTGLQAHRLIAAITGYPAAELALSGVVVSAAVIVSRFLWVFPATYAPRRLVPAIERRYPSPSWRAAFLLAFTGIRGIVSLAAALAIPVVTDRGEPFPHRDLILFLAFCVILVTLAGQGLLLPLVIRWLDLAHEGRQERCAARIDEMIARQRGAEAGVERLNQLASGRDLPPNVIGPIKARLCDRLEQARRRASRHPDEQAAIVLNDEIELALIAAERDMVDRLSRGGDLEDQPRRRIERELDLREAHLANLRLSD